MTGNSPIPLKVPNEIGINEPIAYDGILWKCALTAFFLEASILTLVGWHEHWLAHPHSTELDTTQFVDAQIFEIPEEAHLVEEKKVAPVVKTKAEVALSTTPSLRKTSSIPQKSIEEENKTEQGTNSPPNHGAIAVYRPSPVIPPYLQNREFKTSVTIDFYINSKGGVTPRLVGPSGSEELDAIAIDTVKSWIFRPAEKDHKAIDTKQRIKIIFEVK